jgi:hypothetical protein
MGIKPISETFVVSLNLDDRQVKNRIFKKIAGTTQDIKTFYMFSRQCKKYFY